MPTVFSLLEHALHYRQKLKIQQQFNSITAIISPLRGVSPHRLEKTLAEAAAGEIGEGSLTQRRRDAENAEVGADHRYPPAKGRPRDSPAPQASGWPRPKAEPRSGRKSPSGCPSRGAAREELANSGTSEGARKGWETRRRNGWTPEQLEENRATVNSLIDDLGQQGHDGKGKAWKNTPMDLGEVSESLAADISAANPNMKATVGTMQTIDQKQLNHALIEHGIKEKLSTNIPITKEDLKKIPDVLSDYDDIIPGKGIADGKKQEAVIFKKRFDDGTMCCVEIDWFRRGDKRHELKFQTMWKERAK